MKIGYIIITHSTDCEVQVSSVFRDRDVARENFGIITNSFDGYKIEDFREFDEVNPQDLSSGPVAVAFLTSTEEIPDYMIELWPVEID